MWTNYYDVKTDTKYEMNLGVLPYISIPRETLKQMKDILEYESVGRIYEAVVNYIYDDIEPESLNKAETSFFNTIIEQITRLSFQYFKKISTLKNQSGAVRVLEGNKSDEKNDCFCPWVENDMTEDEYKSQLNEDELKIISVTR